MEQNKEIILAAQSIMTLYMAAIATIPSMVKMEPISFQEVKVMMLSMAVLEKIPLSGT